MLKRVSMRGRNRCRCGRRCRGYIHWVDGPKNQGEASNGAEECSSLGVLVLYHTTTVDCELVDYNQVGNASNGVPAPLGAALDSEGSEEASQDHDEISDDSNENVGSSQTSEQAEI